jgi:hypothetical protein
MYFYNDLFKFECISILNTIFFTNIQPFCIPSYVHAIASEFRFLTKIFNFQALDSQDCRLEWRWELLMDAFWRANDQWERLQRNAVSFATFWKMPLIYSSAKEVSFLKKIECRLIWPRNMKPELLSNVIEMLAVDVTRYAFNISKKSHA